MHYGKNGEELRKKENYYNFVSYTVSTIDFKIIHIINEKIKFVIRKERRFLFHTFKGMWFSKPKEFMEYCINIIFSNNKTIIGKLVRFFSKYNYSHASFALNNDFSKVYSYARYYNCVCIPSGFKCENLSNFFENSKGEIFTISISKEEYDKIVLYLNYLKNKKPGYNYLELIMLKFNIGIIDGDKYVCSTFVAKILSLLKCITLSKEIHLYTVKDLYLLISSISKKSQKFYIKKHLLNIE